MTAHRTDRRGRRRHRGLGRGRPGDRARVRARGAHVALLARGRTGSSDGRPRGRGARRHGARRSRSTSPTPTQVEAAAAAVEERFGPIDVWVNDAMATIFAPVTRDQRRGVRARHRGHLPRHGVRHDGGAAADAAARPRRRSSRSARRSSYRAIPLQSAYCGAKFAIRGFTDSVRTELLHDRSRVWITMVQLPAVNTPQFNWCRTKLPNHPQPVPPIFQPEVPAEAVVLGGPPPPPRAHRRRKRGQGDRRPTSSRPRFADRYLGTHRLRRRSRSRTCRSHRPPRQPLRAGTRPGRDARHVRRPSLRAKRPGVGNDASWGDRLRGGHRRSRGGARSTEAVTSCTRATDGLNTKPRRCCTRPCTRPRPPATLASTTGAWNDGRTDVCTSGHLCARQAGVGRTRPARGGSGTSIPTPNRTVPCGTLSSACSRAS